MKSIKYTTKDGICTIPCPHDLKGYNPFTDKDEAIMIGSMSCACCEHRGDPKTEIITSGSIACNKSIVCKR